MGTPAELTSSIPEGRGDAPWAGYEYVKGWGVFGLPFDSGHVLALRVMPQGSFEPYRAIWHRNPEGRWSINVDGPRVELGCPRYFGPACEEVGPTHIDVKWTGPYTLQVRADQPRLEWAVTFSRSPVMALVNPLNQAMPLASWRSSVMVKARELLARGLGMGSLELACEMPSGHHGIFMPERMYLVKSTRAVLAGVDLGAATRTRPNPDIGGVPLPARGVLAIGGGVWKIKDEAEFERIRREVAMTAPSLPEQG